MFLKKVFQHILHGKVRVSIWRVRVRVLWVTIWYLNMNYLPVFHPMLPFKTLNSVSVIIIPFNPTEGGVNFKLSLQLNVRTKSLGSSSLIFHSVADLD